MEPSYDSIPPILVFGIIIFDAWHSRDPYVPCILDDCFWCSICACGVGWFQLFGLELSNILRVRNLSWIKKKYFHI